MSAFEYKVPNIPVTLAHLDFQLVVCFELLYDKNEVHEGAAIRFNTSPLKFAAVTELNAGIALKSKPHERQKEGTLASYCEAINCLLVTYATDDLISETDA